jgi:hypothetical protein
MFYKLYCSESSPCFTNESSPGFTSPVQVLQHASTYAIIDWLAYHRVLLLKYLTSVMRIIVLLALHGNSLSFFPKLRGFKMASLNVTSLPKHFDELRILLASGPIAISWTRLDSSIIVTVTLIMC